MKVEPWDRTAMDRRKRAERKQQKHMGGKSLKHTQISITKKEVIMKSDTERSIEI